MGKTLSMDEAEYLRFIDNVLVDDGCWEWGGGRTADGYGRLWVGGREAYTHRLAYELWVGSIPEEHFVLHRCDHPPCLRPDHLFVGTAADNFEDMRAKGRFTPTPSLRAVCQQGHPYSGDNLRIVRRSDGRVERACRACGRAASARFQRR